MKGTFTIKRRFFSKETFLTGNIEYNQDQLDFSLFLRIRLNQNHANCKITPDPYSSRMYIIHIVNFNHSPTNIYNQVSLYLLHYGTVKLKNLRSQSLFVLSSSLHGCDNLKKTLS